MSLSPDRDRPKSPELIFRREENKFFLPLSHGNEEKLITTATELCANLGYQEELHTNPLTLTVYYFPVGEDENLSPGFTIRYRQYIPKGSDISTTLKTETGFYEIKWIEWDKKHKKQIKHKIRIPMSYFPDLAISNLIKQLSSEHPEYLDFMRFISNNPSLENRPLTPTFLLTYRRKRFRSTSGNVISIDTNLSYYTFLNFKSYPLTSNQTELQPLGNVEGVIVEYKEKKKILKCAGNFIDY